MPGDGIGAVMHFVSSYLRDRLACSGYLDWHFIRFIIEISKIIYEGAIVLEQLMGLLMYYCTMKN